MNVGKTLFTQIIGFVPWTSFGRIVDRYSGNAGVRTINCAEQFRVMAFAQLTWRESLRDIDITLAANENRLCAIELRNEIPQSTLSDANESRDWRIWFDFAALLTRRARNTYSDCELGLDLSNTGYPLDSTTIDLCLSLFEWASFRSTRAAVKMHTLLHLRGNIPTFIHISDGKMGDVNVLDIMPIEAGAFYVMDRGYLDFARLYLILANAGSCRRTMAHPAMRRRVALSTCSACTGHVLGVGPNGGTQQPTGVFPGRSPVDLATSCLAL